MKKLIFSFFVLLLACISAEMDACTSAIISGRVTPDGRPILWKQRDTGSPENVVRYFKGEKYNFTAISAVGTKEPKSVWGGTNDAGFAIINTVSYNIDTLSKGTNNGTLMKKALATCATVDEFESLLKSLQPNIGVATNYGVIDAQGNGAYFEVGDKEYVKFDVNDPATAPLGYLVRSNFSFAGNTVTGHGYIRFQYADEVVRAGVLHKEITPEYIFENLSRSFNNPFLGIDLKSGDFNKPKTNGWFIEMDIITRRKSTSTMVVQGVRKGEDPSLTAMWTIISYPPTTVAVPIFNAAGKECLPSVVTPGKDGNATLGHYGYVLKERAYSFDTELERNDLYFNWELLYNLQGTGYMQRVCEMEKGILPAYHKALDGWRKNGKIDKAELKALNESFDATVLREYAEQFGL